LSLKILGNYTVLPPFNDLLDLLQGTEICFPALGNDLGLP
jgi:hypothetical protein